jgi:hypothetical protein
MFVVDKSSTGAEILCRIVPGKECLVVSARCGKSALAEEEEEVDESSDNFRFLRVVKALESDIFAEYVVWANGFEVKGLAGFTDNDLRAIRRGVWGQIIRIGGRDG